MSSTAKRAPSASRSPRSCTCARRATSCASASARRALRSLDEQLLRLARTRGHARGVERAVARFSRLGEHGGVWLAIGAAGYTLDRAERRAWRGALTRVVGAYALNTAIKPLVGRRRPELADLPPLSSTPTHLSFPSAHATTAFALGLSLSRLYLGVHYPSDVLAGALLGVFVAGAGRHR